MVERAFRLLDLVASSDVGYSLSELARLLGMSKGSVFGLLRTLEHGGVVEVDEDRRYALGPRIYHLAETYVRRSGLRRFALPAMQRLAARTGEAVFLGQVESDSVRIVELVEVQSGRTALRLSARRGAYLHLRRSYRAGGGQLADRAREEYLQRRDCHTSPSIRLPGVTSMWRRRETARTGVGIDHDEYPVGVSAGAAAINGLDGELLAHLDRRF
jgi:DNA-binding IclR family transcriptional regulator